MFFKIDFDLRATRWNRKRNIIHFHFLQLIPNKVAQMHLYERKIGQKMCQKIVQILSIYLLSYIVMYATKLLPNNNPALKQIFCSNSNFHARSTQNNFLLKSVKRIFLSFLVLSKTRNMCLRIFANTHETHIPVLSLNESKLV